MQQGGLARARRAGDGDEFTLVDGQAHPRNLCTGGSPGYVSVNPPRQGSEHDMDEFGTTAGASGNPVPGQPRSLFNHPDDVRVQELPCALPGLGSLAVHFGAGARTVPHQHHNGQHLVFVEGVGAVADEDGVHVVRAGDVVSNPPGAWHWHGATPGAAATHVTFEAPGDFDLDVERRDWDDTYGPDLGT
jgi:mannose-6-phosphate isomerase-like protein (cupin superfamily)